MTRSILTQTGVYYFNNYSQISTQRGDQTLLIHHEAAKQSINGKNLEQENRFRSSQRDTVRATKEDPRRG